MNWRQAFAALIVLVLVLPATLPHAGAAAAISPQADLDIKISESADPVVAGEELQYIATVTNKGPHQAANVQTVISLPLSATLETLTPSAGCAQGAGVITCTSALIAAGGSASFSLLFAVAPEARGALTAGARTSSSVTDPVASNNSAAISTVVEPEVDLRLAHLSTEPSPAIAGAPLRYQLRVDNAGASTATDVELHATLPPGRLGAFLSVSPGYGCVGGTATLDCDLGTVAPAGVEREGWVSSGSVITFEVQLLPTLLPTDTLHYTAYLEGLEEELDHDNNFAYQDQAVERLSDLEVIVQGPPQTDLWWSYVTYAITVTNHGPSEQRDVLLDGVFSRASLRSRTIEAPGCSYVLGQVDCAFGAMAVGESRTVSISGWLRAPYLPQISLVGSAAGVDPEPAGGRPNTATHTLQPDAFNIWLPMLQEDGA